MATSGAECNFVIVSARAVRLSLNRRHISGQRPGVSLNTETQQWLYVEYCEDCTGGLEFHSRVQLQRVGCVHIYAQAHCAYISAFLPDSHVWLCDTSFYGRKIIRNNVINRWACLTWFKEEQVLKMRQERLEQLWEVRWEHGSNQNQNEHCDCLTSLCFAVSSCPVSGDPDCDAFNSHRPSISISNYFHHLLQLKK